MLSTLFRSKNRRLTKAEYERQAKAIVDAHRNDSLTMLSPISRSLSRSTSRSTKKALPPITGKYLTSSFDTKKPLPKIVSKGGKRKTNKKSKSKSTQKRR